MSVRRRVVAVCCLVLAAAGVSVTTTAEAEPIQPVSEWSDPIPISTDAGAAISPRVGMDASGNATAVWLQDVNPDVAITTNAIHAAYRPAGGSWGTPTVISDGSAPNIASYSFAEGPTGQALVVWQRFDGVRQRLRFTERPTGGNVAWTTPVYLFDNPAITLVSFNANVEVGVDGALHVVWQGQDVENDNEVYTAMRPAGGSWDIFQLSAGDGTFPTDVASTQVSVATSTAGQWLAIWRTVTENGVSIRIRGSLENGSTSSVTPVSDLDRNGDFPKVWGDPEGGWVRSWEEEEPITEDALVRVVGMDDDHSGLGDTLVYDAPDTDGASAGDAAFHNGHSVVMMKMVDGNGNSYMRVTRRQDGGDWSAPAEPLDVRNSVVEGDLAVDAGGIYTVAFRQGASPYRARVAQLAPGQTEWTMVQTLSDHVGGDNAINVRVAAGPAGSTLVVWQQTIAGVPRVLSSHVTATATPDPPAAAMTKPTKNRVTSLSIPVAWTGTDMGAGIESYDVRYRQGAWNENLGAPITWQDDVTTTSATFAAAAGTTYCFSAAATDTLDQSGDYSAERCATTPVDDRTLTRSSGWTIPTQSGNFLDTITKTKKKGATLKLNGVLARSVGLLVHKKSSGGSVKVTFAGQSLGTFSLKGTAKKKVIIAVKNFTSVKSGSLVIKVVSADGKDVIVDGVFLNK